MLIASLAAISARADALQQVLRSVLAQTRPPDKILVHYSEEPWHLDAGWSQPPPVPAHPCIELVKVPNLGSCRKYIFAAQAYRETDATLILLDDDRAWHPSVFERVVDFVHRTDEVATTRGWTQYSLRTDAEGQQILHDTTVIGASIDEPARVQVVNSGWATCLKARHVNTGLFDPQLQAEVQMRYSDEIILSAMLERAKYVVPMPADFFTELESPVHQWLSAESTQAKLRQIEWVNAVRPSHG